MGRLSLKNTTLLWVVLVLLSNNLLVLPVFSAAIINKFENEKNYYSSPTDPHLAPNPTSGSHHHGSSHHTSHGGSPSSSGGQSNCSPLVPTPADPSPHHGSGGSGSGGSGGYYPSPTHHKPPSSGGSGGSGGYYPSPTPKPPSGGSGGSGGSYNPTPTPSPPSGGGCVCSPPPSGGGSGGSGGYYRPPPTIPVSPSTPLVPSPPYITPVTPTLPSPPLVPITPGTPTPFDPNTPPFPCTYWGKNPALIFGVLGWWATLGGVMGVGTLPGLSSATSLQQVLNNPRNDGYGALYREGAASFLNSVAAKNFYFTSKQVRDSFLSSLGSDKAAAHQAKLFKLANEGKLKKNN